MKPALVIACAAMTFADAAMAAEPSACKMELIAMWQVRENYYLPVIDGTINGHKVGILLDTGASSSLIERAAVRKLGLTTFSLSEDGSYGVGGLTRSEGTDIQELRIGNAVRRNWRARVVGEHGIIGDVAMVLGDDLFGKLDVEFDLAANTVRLFRPQNCARAWLGYWAPDSLAVPLQSLDRPHVEVSVNGQTFLALVDSGASQSTLTEEAARYLGVTPATPGVTAGGCISGFGKQRYESWIAPFQSFAIGDQVIRNPRLSFAPLWQHVRFEPATGSALRRRPDNLPDMLLGADFLRSHRVFIAHSQRKMYFSHTGGPVFPVEPGKPCSASQTR